MRNPYIYLLAFAGWTIFFWNHYVHNIKQVGISTSNTVSEIPLAPSTTLPIKKQLLFMPKTFGPIIKGSINALSDSILSKGNDNQLIQITGYYSPNEQIGLDFDLGLARASELKKILLDRIEEDRIEIYSDTISNFITYEDDLIEAVLYEWVDGYDIMEEQEPENYYLLEHDTKRVRATDFESLLEQIAERVKLSGETVIIRGHTDSKGDDEINFILAHRNAKDIRDVFRAKGVMNSQIKTSTQGEDIPIGDNQTEEGRLKNRRIEIEFN